MMNLDDVKELIAGAVQDMDEDKIGPVFVEVVEDGLRLTIGFIGVNQKTFKIKVEEE